MHLRAVPAPAEAPWTDEPLVEQLLHAARRRLTRVAPGDVAAEIAAGAVLVDIRPLEQRRRDGTIPGAIPICRNVLEWRCDPSSPWRDERVADPARRLILICDEGYQSSLAAATLLDVGRPGATDVIDGFRGWLAAGLPVSRDEGSER